MSQNTEQKSAVRTRDEQVMAFGHDLIDLRGSKSCTELAVAERHILEAEARGAEEQRRKDAEASKANAGWNFLTENVSSDPELPSCRLSTLFQEGDELSRFQRAAQEFGIEVRLVADDRDDEDCDKELSVEILSKFDPCQFLIRDGWSFVDVWENDEGGIIRLFARAALTREGGV